MQLKIFTSGSKYKGFDKQSKGNSGIPNYYKEGLSEGWSVINSTVAIGITMSKVRRATHAGSWYTNDGEFI